MKFDEDGQLGDTPSLREADALRRSLDEVARQREGRDLVISGVRRFERWFAESVQPDLRRPGLRTLPTGVVVLPVQRDTAYLQTTGVSLSSPKLPVELGRPSSTIRVATPGGADLGVQIVTLRPRPVTDWIASARPVPDGRFNDGSILLAASLATGTSNVATLRLYWDLPAAGVSSLVGEQVFVDVGVGQGGSRNQSTLPFTPLEARRPGELTLMSRAILQDRPSRLQDPIIVRLLNAHGQPIGRSDGSIEIVLPIGSPQP